MTAEEAQRRWEVRRGFWMGWMLSGVFTFFLIALGDCAGKEVIGGG